jgi:hypothetical protein
MNTNSPTQLLERVAATSHLKEKSLRKKLAKLPVLTLSANELKRLRSGRSKVKVRGVKSSWTIVRMILSYFVHTQDNKDELLRLLFTEHLENHLLKMTDPGYRKKFFKETSSLEGLIQYYLKVKISNPVLVKPSLLRYEKQLPAAASMYGYMIELQDKILDFFTRQRPDTLTKLLPPKRYIGVGYKDKGNLRFSYYDGSPSWQDVASTSETTEREIYYKSILGVSYESLVLERKLSGLDTKQDDNPWTRTQYC